MTPLPTPSHVSGTELSSNSAAARSWQVVVVLAVATAAAAWIRARGLGQWCYAVDEFYFSRSVSFILDSGLPRFPDGGYYARGLLVQYLAAIPGWFLGQREITDRLAPFLFGVLTVPLFFVLARRFLALVPATLCTAVLVLSSWHIEFSRFARMYTAFQLVFILFVYALYRGYWRHSRRHVVLCWVVAGVAIAVYEGSVFLPMILALVILRPSSPLSSGRGLLAIGAAAGLTLANLLVRWAGFRHLGVVDALPASPPGAGGGSLPIRMPNVDLAALVPSSPALIAGWAFLAAVGVALLVKTARRRRGWGLLAAVAFAALPLAHQYGTLCFVLLMLVLAGATRREDLVELGRAWWVYLAVSLGYWSLTAFVLTSGYHAGSGSFVRGYKFLLSLFSNFAIHSSVVHPFARDVPVLGGILMLALAVGAVRIMVSPRIGNSGFLLLMSFACLFVLPLVNTKYQSTRYSFFFYPLLLCVLFAEASKLGRWLKRSSRPHVTRWVGGFVMVIPVAAMVVTEDVNLDHIRRVADADVNFRLGRYERWFHHWYGRSDFEGPARFVNESFRGGDVVVVETIVSSRYLEPHHAIYVQRGGSRFADIARRSGTVEVWTGLPLVYDPDSLAGLVPSGERGRLWLIAGVEGPAPGALSPEAVRRLAEENRFAAKLEYVGVDERIGVWRLTDTGAASPPTRPAPSESSPATPAGSVHG